MSSASRTHPVHLSSRALQASNSQKKKPQVSRNREQQRQHRAALASRSHTPASHAMTTQDWASHFWITLVDEEGETFYANPQTGERKWTIPPGSLVLPRSAEGEWYELWSDEYKLPYYFHTVRKETTWYKPDGFVIPLKAVQRFSAGKRFSLSLDSGSTVQAPDAPAVSDETSLPSDTSEIDATRNSGLHDSKCDPFYAAVFKCITGKSALPESPKTQKDETRCRTVSEVKEAKKSSPLLPAARTFYDDTSVEVEDEDALDHVNVSGISLASSLSQTVSTSPSTPLNTPKAPQETFSTPILSSDEYPEVGYAESPYLGIEEAKETVVITADDLIAAIPPIVKKGKTVAPLKIRKKLSMVGLGEPVNLRSPEEKSERGWSKKTGTPKLDAAAIQNSNSSLDTGPKTPGSPGSPCIPRSPSSFFSAVFGRPAMSPEISSSSVATLKEAQEDGISYDHQTPATPVAGFDSPKMDEVTKHGDQLKSPTLDKIKKMFASSQDLFRQSEGSPKDMRRSVSELFKTSSPSSPASPSNPISPSAAAGNASTVPQDLLDEIHRFSFNQYAQEHFAGTNRRHTKIFHRKMLPLEQRMKWQAGDLDMPILHLNKQLRWDALQCFTHLQRVMGDRPLKDSDIRLSMEDANAPSAWDHATVDEARKLLAFGVNVPELRDEIYVQLLCQLSDNPSAISIYRGYQLLQVLLVVFPPSPSLTPTFRQFLLARRGSVPRSRLGIIARYALVKLDDIIAKGPRGAVPTLFEVQAASEGAFQPSVFGETLQRVMGLQVDAYPDAKIPIVLSFLADGVLALGGLKTPGIFRVAGDLDKVKELRIIIDQGRYSFAGYEDPRIAASLFKLWLRELRDPLIPVDWYHQCMEAASSASRCVQIIQRLPSVNRRIVAFVISFLQIFAQDVVVLSTLVPTASLAMIFTPSFFRGPPVSKTFDTSPSGTHEIISKVFHEARVEQQFMLNLLECLDVTRLEDEDDWIPTHGKHNSLSSSLSSSASSVFPVNTSPPFCVPEITGSDGDARPSLESTASTVSLASHTSFGSTKGKHRSNRFRTHTVEPQAEQASSMPTSASFPLRSRAITDSVMLHGKSQSSKDLTARLFSDNTAAPLPPLPDLPFVKPVIVVNEAD